MSMKSADKTLATRHVLPTIFYLPNGLGWWNGRHVRLRGVCRKACGFKSRPEQFTAEIGIEETTARAGMARSPWTVTK